MKKMLHHWKSTNKKTGNYSAIKFTSFKPVMLVLSLLSLLALSGCGSTQSVNSTASTACPEHREVPGTQKKILPAQMCQLPTTAISNNTDYAERFLPDLIATQKACNDHNASINKVNGATN